MVNFVGQMLSKGNGMPEAKIKLLIVDDDALLRTTLSHIFTESGYKVRSAEDGFSALSAIRQELPDLLLCDLNMPGMSGFELLSVVRRRFPAIHVIAMSGAFSGDGLQLGVAADAFYEKATSLSSLLKTVEAMAHPERRPLRHLGASVPIWIPRNGHNPAGESYVIITCSECLRTFPQILSESPQLIHETGCVYCGNLIHYAIIQLTDPALPQAFQRKPGVAIPIFLSLPEIQPVKVG